MIKCTQQKMYLKEVKEKKRIDEREAKAQKEFDSIVQDKMEDVYSVMSIRYQGNKELIEENHEESHQLLEYLINDHLSRSVAGLPKELTGYDQKVYDDIEKGREIFEETLAMLKEKVGYKEEVK